MKSAKEVLDLINQYIELEGFRKEYLAKMLNISLDELYLHLNGVSEDIIEFSKKLAKARRYDESFFLTNKAELYNKSQILNLVLFGQDFEKYVPKQNIEKIHEEMKIFTAMDEEIEKRESELKKIKEKWITKKLDIENLL